MNTDDMIKFLIESGAVKQEEFDNLVEQYKKEAPGNKNATSSAILLQMFIKKELKISILEKQVAELLMMLLKGGKV